jgi:hypothetical protein
MLLARWMGPIAQISSASLVALPDCLDCWLCSLRPIVFPIAASAGLALLALLPDGDALD